MVDMKKKATDILEDYSNSYSQVDLETLTKFLEQIKSEAIKEFAKRLNARIRKDIDEQGMFPLPYTKKAYDNVKIFIDNLVKEMTEQANFTKIEHNSLCETETYKGGE